jgi:hypothetical protein
VPILTTQSAKGYGFTTFTQPAVSTSYESIATITVSSATSTVEFTSIPGTFAHLELRALSVTNSNYNGASLQFNNDTTASNYRSYFIYGSGGGGAANSAQNTDVLYAPNFNGKGATTAPGPVILTIFDYANTNKYKTITCLDGGVVSGSDGFVALNAGHWESTAAITSMKINLGTTFTYSQYAHFALYGIKAA